MSSSRSPQRKRSPQRNTMRKSPSPKRKSHSPKRKIPIANTGEEAREFIRENKEFRLHQRVDELDLRYLIVEKLPDWFGKLTPLVNLNIKSNMLSSLPVGFGQLNNLKVLNLSRNEFKIFPIEIGYLKELIDLDLSENQLTIIPAEINNLEKLRSLDVRENPLERISHKIRADNIYWGILEVDVKRLQKEDKIEEKTSLLRPLEDYNIHSDYVKKLLLRQ